MVRAFGYLKCVPNYHIAIDHRPMRFKQNKPNYEVIRPDYLEDYPDAVEKWDMSFHQPFGSVMETTFMVD